MIALGAVVLLAGAAGVAYATVVVPRSSRTIVGCAQKQTGALRIVNSAVECRSTESVVNFAAPPRPLIATVNCGAGQKLQAAVDAADATQPLTIDIIGTCAESVTIDRDQVTLRSGSSGSGVTGSLYFTGRRETVDGITVTGAGDGPPALGVADGGSLAATNVHVTGMVGVDTNATMGLSNATISHSDSGCGVNAGFGGHISVDSSTITGCSVKASSNASVWLNGVTISGAGVLVGGVAVNDGASAVLTNDTISSSTYFVVDVDGGTATLNNTAVSGGTNGVGVSDGGSVAIIDGSLVSGNGAGVVANSGSHVNISSDNSDAGGGHVNDNTGVGVEITGASTLTMSSFGEVKGNGGDGIDLSDSSVGSFDDPVIQDNGGWGLHCDTAPSVAVERGPTNDTTGNTAGQVDCQNAGQPG
jgi:hypothetical protein